MKKLATAHNCGSWVRALCFLVGLFLALTPTVLRAGDPSYPNSPTDREIVPPVSTKPTDGPTVPTNPPEKPSSKSGGLEEFESEKVLSPPDGPAEEATSEKEGVVSPDFWDLILASKKTQVVFVSTETGETAKAPTYEWKDLRELIDKSIAPEEILAFVGDKDYEKYSFEPGTLREILVEVFNAAGEAWEEWKKSAGFAKDDREEKIEDRNYLEYFEKKIKWDLKEMSFKELVVGIRDQLEKMEKGKADPSAIQEFEKKSAGLLGRLVYLYVQWKGDLHFPKKSGEGRWCGSCTARSFVYFFLSRLSGLYVDYTLVAVLPDGRAIWHASNVIHYLRGRGKTDVIDVDFKNVNFRELWMRKDGVVLVVSRKKLVDLEAGGLGWEDMVALLYHGEAQSYLNKILEIRKEDRSKPEGKTKIAQYYRDAIALYERALSLSPAQAGLFYNEKAFAHSRLALILGPGQERLRHKDDTVTNYRESAREYAKIRAYRLAIESYKEVEKWKETFYNADPDEDFHYEVGRVYFQWGKSLQGPQEMNRALTLRPLENTSRPLRGFGK